MTKNLLPPSTSSRREVDENNAVKFRKAYKSFVTKNDATIVLRNLNMTVPKGVLYGLVGASRCGKTTLLNCIIGRRKLDSGELWVLKDGIKADKPRVGFMPQQMALYQEFTVWESMRHFGWLIAMPTEVIATKARFLVELLELPDIHQKVKFLDHGAKKLVSFAIVLLLEPELLILDEPTVGLDPVLREAMWRYLKELTVECKATVILTTHYIDETKYADIVGFMRKGRLIVEDPPRVVMSRFQAQTLETTFWKLSVMQDMVTAASNKTTFYNFSLETDYRARYKVGDHLTDKNGNHWKTMVWKNFLWMFRNWWILLTLITVPVSTCVLFLLCFGRNPYGLKVAFVNYEAGCDLMQCNSTALGCQYLSYLNATVIDLVQHESEYSAIESVLKGETYASIVINENYTEELKLRLDNWQYTSDSNIIESTLHVYKDSSKAPLAVYLKMSMDFSFTRFISDFLTACSMKRGEVLYPFQWKTPLNDLLQVEFGHFSSPGVLLTVIFLFPASLAAVTMVIEKTEGTFDRCVSLGVGPLEMLCAHVIADFTVALILCFATFITIVLSFGLVVKGSYSILVLLITMLCFCGLWFGYLLAIFCKSITHAFYFTLGAFFPLTYLCGILWPIQGMMNGLQFVAYLLPLTGPVEAFRNILQHNWKLSRPPVYQAFFGLIAWTAIFVSICVIITRRVK